MSINDNSYGQGSRSAWVAMLRECLKNLGYNTPVAQKTSWSVEREEAISQLRGICAYFGDNDWDENLALSDIIEKHLARHLHAGRVSGEDGSKLDIIQRKLKEK